MDMRKLVLLVCSTGSLVIVSNGCGGKIEVSAKETPSDTSGFGSDSAYGSGFGPDSGPPPGSTVPPSFPPPPGTCSLPKALGSCAAGVRSFWFNEATGRCESFPYGGCLGNANRFGSIEACARACAPASAEDACAIADCDPGEKCAYADGVAVCTDPCVRADDGRATCDHEWTCGCTSSSPASTECEMRCYTSNARTPRR